MREPEAHLPLTESTFHILMALADGERHGYAIMRDVAERTGGAATLGPGTLYTSLKRLLGEGLVEEHEDRRDGDDERRRYYRLTALGRAVARAEARRLLQLVRLAESRRLVRVGPA